MYPVGLGLSLVLAPFEAALELLAWGFDQQFDFLGPGAPIELRYLIQKSFVEAHAVTPRHRKVQSWVKGFWLIRRACYKLKPYRDAHRRIFNAEGKLNDKADTFRRYIACDGFPRRYEDYVAEAEQLSDIYIRALLRLHEAEIDEHAPQSFMRVVQEADLASPLQEVTAAKAQAALDNWDQVS